MLFYSIEKNIKRLQKRKYELFNKNNRYCYVYNTFHNTNKL